MAAPKIKVKPFTMVRRSLWDSRRFAALPDDLHRYLYFYFLTCQHQTGTGCFVAKEAYVLADLAKPGADWSPETLGRRKLALADAGLILCDDQTSEILVLGWWNDNGPTNDDWFKGAQRQCDAIESQKLRETAQEALAACHEAMLVARGLPPRLVPRLIGQAPTPQDRLAAIRERIGGGGI